MFVRTVTRKNGKRYAYLEERYRGDDGKGKSRSRSLGPVGGHVREPGWLKRQFPPTHGLDWDAIEKQMIEKMDEKEAKDKAFKDEMHEKYGMRFETSPVP